MAITYLQQPTNNSVQASDNPIVFVFSSNQTTQANFSFIVDTVYNGVVVSTQMVFPERGNRAKFDAKIVTLPATKATPRSNGYITMQTLPTVQIRVSERYGTTPVTQPYSASNTCKVMKAICDNESYSLNWLTSKYPPGVKWLTDVPNSTMYVSRKHPIWASILNTDPEIQVDAYMFDASNTVIGLMSEQRVGDDKVNVNLLTADMNATLFPATLEDVERIELYMNQSQVLNIEFLDEDCAEYHQVNWQNNLGTYDQFLFSHNLETESAISIKEYKKQFGSWDSSNVFVHDPLTSGDTQYLKTSQPTGTLYTGYVLEAYQNWLNRIYASLDVLLLEPTAPTVQRINVTNSSATDAQDRFEDLINFEVKYKKTNYKSLSL